MEDARFVLFTDTDGSTKYYATYTAYDGFSILPQLIETEDFVRFTISTLNGAAAQNKGMALFPRRIGGKYVMLSRRDRENLHLSTSTDVHRWDDLAELYRPQHPWELLQVGNCGSPIETPAGWLVLTHGVGPMRRYAIGAMLLDLEQSGARDRALVGAAHRARRERTGRLRAERRVYLRCHRAPGRARGAVRVLGFRHRVRARAHGRSTRRPARTVAPAVQAAASVGTPAVAKRGADLEQRANDGPLVNVRISIRAATYRQLVPLRLPSNNDLNSRSGSLAATTATRRASSKVSGRCDRLLTKR